MSEGTDAQRQFVADRANGRCEYCLFPDDVGLLPYTLEHIIAPKHGGADEVENMAYACPFCSHAKGNDIASIDPVTGLLTSLYNPRTQTWSDHFEFVGAEFVPLTEFGRVTVHLLKLNHPDRVDEREVLITAHRLP